MLTPAPEAVFHRRGDPDDPRMGDVVRRWDGRPVELTRGQPVLIGFPIDEGVRRNRGRPGAALAPDAIREQLYRLTTWDPESPRLTGRSGAVGTDLGQLGLLDVGNIHAHVSLEEAQEALALVVGVTLKAEAVPIVLGGGHEVAYGHFLGFVHAGLTPAIINVDAHLDVRRYPQGGHSGSSFRQAREHPAHPLADGRYVVIGAQRQSVARAHWEFVLQHHGRIHWCNDDLSGGQAVGVFTDELSRMKGGFTAGGMDGILLSVDADAFRQADVPGVSAPSPIGLEGAVWPELALHAGLEPTVRSIELAEVNPTLDRDGQTVRWAALGIRQFLVGLAGR